MFGMGTGVTPPTKPPGNERVKEPAVEAGTITLCVRQGKEERSKRSDRRPVKLDGEGGERKK